MDITGSLCYVAATCVSGGLLNPAQNKCELPASYVCASDYTYNATYAVCQSTPICNVGAFNATLDKCVVVGAAICPTGYTFNPELDNCQINPPCPTEATYSTTVDKCVVDANHSCPSFTYYYSITRLCEADPLCTEGSYNGDQNKCYKGDTTCTIGNYSCIENGSGKYQCSPYPCIDITVPSSVELEKVDDSMLQNDGAKDEQGNCLGEVYLFTGRGLRCRTSGIDSGWQNCCVKGEAMLKDSVGKLTELGTAANALQHVYHIGQIAYYANTAIANAWTGAETIEALTAAGYSSEVVNATGAAVEAGSIGVGMQSYAMSVFNPYTIAISVAIQLAIDTFLSGGCDQQDLETAMLDASGRCHYVGEWCEKKWPLFGCVQKSKGYCCFNSKLARIIHEKGRPQLKTFQPAGAWGTERPAGPNCRGFTSAEFQMLDFSKIDLSEYFGEITAKAQSEIITGTQDKISEFYNRIQGR